MNSDNPTPAVASVQVSVHNVSCDKPVDLIKLRQENYQLYVEKSRLFDALLSIALGKEPDPVKFAQKTLKLS